MLAAGLNPENAADQKQFAAGVYANYLEATTKLVWGVDPYLAIHTSLVDPLPHKITAVYGEMLPRQPLRFLLADEAPDHEEYRRRLIAARETDAHWYANLYEVGWPHPY